MVRPTLSLSPDNLSAHTPPHTTHPRKMSPYNTRSAVRKQALEPYEGENVTESPSATGKGTHIRWTYSSNEVPTFAHSGSLEPGPSSNHPVTPDQGEDEEFQRSPTTCSTEIPDEQASYIAEDYGYSAGEQDIMERMLAQLQGQKKAAEERAAAKALEHHDDPQLMSDRSTNRELSNQPGPKIPLGVTGFGRTGTWVAENVWRPAFVSSTDQLPSVREFGKEEEVQDPPPNNVAREDPSRNPGFRMLTPLPSFVEGNGGVEMM